MRVDPVRSRIMRAVRRADTTPELRVRRVAHALGFRYRLHRKDLPGTPDIVFSKLRTVVFVHGCFWHRHRGCAKASTPRTRAAFWRQKFESNVDRDGRAAARLKAAGWRVAVVWECQTSDPGRLQWQVLRLLATRKAHSPNRQATGPKRLAAKNL